jgi:hypothetical protein
MWLVIHRSWRAERRDRKEIDRADATFNKLHYLDEELPRWVQEQQWGCSI